MELWIRSQDKEKLCNIYKVYYESWSFNEQHHTVRCENHELGEYSTRERCLEIIDEIQLLLENNGSIDDRISQDISGIKNEFIVYEMPQE